MLARTSLLTLTGRDALKRTLSSFLRLKIMKCLSNKQAQDRETLDSRWDDKFCICKYIPVVHPACYVEGGIVNSNYLSSDRRAVLLLKEQLWNSLNLTVSLLDGLEFRVLNGVMIRNHLRENRPSELM
ncbi:hypothetical protein Tco_0546460 [Tanacetum coccineum]